MAGESRKKVLVIEDEPSIRNNIMLMLKVERYAATGAENGRVGLEQARSDPPDLILCDVMMPEMDGFAVLEALRAEPRLAEMALLKQSRLSVQPVSAPEWKLICGMGGLKGA